MVWLAGCVLPSIVSVAGNYFNCQLAAVQVVGFLMVGEVVLTVLVWVWA